MQVFKDPLTMEMPKILYGTAWKKELTAHFVLEAIDSGFRGIDTACQPRHYNEALVGAALSQCAIAREELFIQTKFTPASGQDADSVPYDPAAPYEIQVTQSFEVSKKNLQTNYVDSLVLHSPIFPFVDLMKVWSSMEEIYLRGEAKMIGISNCYDLPLLMRLYSEAKVKPSVVQNRFYRDTNYDIPLRAWCKEHGIAYQSFWSLTANPHLLHADTIISLAIKYRKSPAQIFFSYLMSQGITPLSGTTSKEHMLQDLEIDANWLETDEIAAITRLLQ